MTVIGLIGGIAPESTVSYYRQLVAGHRALHPDSYPQIVINSIDMTRMLELMGRGDRSDLIAFLADEVERVHHAGASFGAFASNTPHLVFAEVQARTRMPLLSIVDATADAVAASGAKCVALLGSRFTMEGGFYQSRLAASGIECVTPGPEERRSINEFYFGELVKGIFRPETRERLLSIVQHLARDLGAEQVILGGTELPLILTPEYPAAVPLIDTMEVHVRAILARAERGA